MKDGGNYLLPDKPFGGLGVAGLEKFLERKTFATVVG